MGRGGGSHGGGFHSHRSYSRRRYRGRRGGGGGGGGGLASNIVLTVFIGIFMVAVIAGFICLLVMGSVVGDICDGISNINAGEQRTCRTLKTEDVKLSEPWTGVTAYRYDSDNMPPTETRTTNITYKERVRSYGWEYYDFALSANGTVNFTYKVVNNDSTMDVHLMTLKQYEHFASKERVGDTLWSIYDTYVAQHDFTAAVGGVHYIVIDNQKRSGFYVREELNITTDVYLVDPNNTKEYCSGSQACKFKDVEPTETIVVYYNNGSSSYADVEVYHGKGSFNKNLIVPIIFMIFFIIVVAGFWVLLTWTVCKDCSCNCDCDCDCDCGMRTKKAVKKTDTSQTKVSQPVATPGTVPMTPVGPTSGAAPPAPSEPSYPYAGTENPYPDGMPPPDPMNPYGVPAYGIGTDSAAATAPPPGYTVDPSAPPAPSTGHVDYYGAPSSMV